MPAEINIDASITAKKVKKGSEFEPSLDEIVRVMNKKIEEGVTLNRAKELRKAMVGTGSSIDLKEGLRLIKEIDKESRKKNEELIKFELDQRKIALKKLSEFSKVLKRGEIEQETRARAGLKELAKEAAKMMMAEASNIDWVGKKPVTREIDQMMRPKHFDIQDTIHDLVERLGRAISPMESKPIWKVERGPGGELQRVPSGLSAKVPTGGAATGAAAAAGIVATGMLVVKGLHDMVQNSKIVAKVQEAYNSIMGTLMDLILLPFLPILALGMVKLVGAFLTFGKWWRDIWDTIKKEGLFGLIKLGLEWIWDKLTDLGRKLLNIIFDNDSPVDKLVRLNALINPIGPLLDIWEWFVDFLFGKGTWDKVVNIALGFVSTLSADLQKFLVYAWYQGGKLFWEFMLNFKENISAFIGWWWEMLTNPKKGLSIAFSVVVGAADALIDWLYDFAINSRTYKFFYELFGKDVNGLIQWLYDIVKTVTWIGFNLNINIISDVLNWLYGIVRAGGEVALKIQAQLPSFAVGGTVPGYPGEPKLAVVHGGEQVVTRGTKSTPAAEDTGRVVNYIFNGYQDEALVRKVRDIMRQDATRYRL